MGIERLLLKRQARVQYHGRVKSKPTRIGICSFPAWRLAIIWTVWNFHCVCRQVDRGKLDSKTKKYICCLLANTTWRIKCDYIKLIGFFVWFSPNVVKKNEINGDYAGQSKKVLFSVSVYLFFYCFILIDLIRNLARRFAEGLSTFFYRNKNCVF